MNVFEENVHEKGALIRAIGGSWSSREYATEREGEAAAARTAAAKSVERMRSIVMSRTQADRCRPATSFKRMCTV